MKNKLKIGIMDADLLERKNHRFPNLVSEKISNYYKKEKNADVALIFDYSDFDKYDEIFISKVFTNTPIPSWLINYVEGEYLGDKYEQDTPNWINNKKKPKIHIGGTGFYFDKAPNLPEEIEHYMPDYHLYDSWIDEQIKKAKLKCEKEGKEFQEKRFKKQFKEYLEYSIGFLTRGCFRKCAFCVNQKYDHSFIASPLNEFYDESRKKICLLDDNFLSNSSWKELLTQLIETKKSFKFKQGLDERLLNEEKCKILFNSKYDGDFTFAFDKIEDYQLINEKLEYIKKYNKRKGVMFYVLVGFESCDEKDIENAFKRIELLFKFKCIPYIMRYMSKEEAPWKESEFRSMYVTLARWCNQPRFVKKMTFREFCIANQNYQKLQEKKCASYKAMIDFEEKYPEIAKKYFDMKFGDTNEQI